MIVLAIRGKAIMAACFMGIVLGVLLMGQSPAAVGAIFQKSLGSTTVLIGVIIMMGAGLGSLMSEVGVTHTLVLWIVRGIGVNTQARGKIALMVSSLSVCGLLGTMGGGNAVIAPIMIPILGSLGVTPSVVAALMKLSGEVGLVLGPLTGVTLLTMEVTGLTYGQLMLGAALPFCFFFVIGAWYGTARAQKRTEGQEAYTLADDVKSLDSIVIKPKERNATIVFLLAFLALVVYGILTKQKTPYAVVVMLILIILVAVVCRVDINRANAAVTKGLASQASMVIIFLEFEILIHLVNAGGGFKALAATMSNVAGNDPSIVYLVASLVGSFFMEMAAVAKIKVMGEMFGATMAAAKVPMSMFAISIIAATRITSSVYPATNFAIALGVAQCTNLKEVWQACLIACASAWAFIAVWSFIGVRVMPW